MEHEEEIRSQVDDLDERAGEMDEKTDALQERVDEVREEFESKQSSDDVPGAQPPGGHEQGEEPPPEADITPED